MKTLLFILLSFFGLALQAEIKLPAIISDNMVLQADMKAPIWGWAKPGEEVTFTFQGQSLKTKAAKSGRWQIDFKDLKAGSTGELVISASNNIIIKNVLVGEVWVASGQSNMGFSLAGSKDGKAEIKKANFPEMRLFKVPPRGNAKIQHDVKAKWVIISLKNAAGMSAVAYYFAKKIHLDQKVPVGVIQSAYGGASVEAWSPKEIFDRDPNAKTYLAYRNKAIKKFYDAMAAWQKTKKGKKPRQQKGGREQHGPAWCYNAMLAPVIPYGMRGVIWYQGEFNTSFPSFYENTFSQMMKSWRAKWGQGDFPFYFVQLANFLKRADQPGPSAWADVRQAQKATLKLKNTGMAVIIDIGDAGNIHPKNKLDVGKRLALQALKKTYGKDIPFSGPLAVSAKLEDGLIRIRFDKLFGGLEARGELKGFALAGADGKFTWATARIDGESVLIDASAFADPAFVSYAWADNPVAPLYNKAGLPAGPFKLSIKK